MWDNPNDNLLNFRKRIYEPYKGKRDEKPLPFIEQFHLLQKMLGDMGIFQLMDENGEYEADDLIGSLTTYWKQQTDGKVYIVSNDKDLYQLLDERTYQLMKIKKEDVCYSLEDFVDEYGIPPLLWIDSKAIMGDSSDNYTGVKKVGVKSTFPLLKRYGTLENILNHLFELEETKEFKSCAKYFKEDMEYGLLCKKLATIVTDIHLNEISDVLIDLKLNIHKENKIRIFKRLRFM